MPNEEINIVIEETVEQISVEVLDNNENITVVIQEPAGVSNHSDLNLDDGTNPHGTTKSDVGLGNVPNLDTTDAVNNEHTHLNKVILDLITEAFTTALKNSYDSVVSGYNNLINTGARLITSDEITKLSNTSGTNTGDQDLSGLMVKSNNLSDVQSVSTARNNLGLGSLATQNGTFSGLSSGTNTGDETILSIQTKRPLKTVDSQSLEGTGNITTTIKLTKVEILSSALITQDEVGFLTYINSVTPFSIASNERVRYVVTDTRQIFDIEVNNVIIGIGHPALTLNHITEVEKPISYVSKTWRFTDFTHNAFQPNCTHTPTAGGTVDSSFHRGGGIIVKSSTTSGSGYGFFTSGGTGKPVGFTMYYEFTKVLSGIYTETANVSILLGGFRTTVNDIIVEVNSSNNVTVQSTKNTLVTKSGILYTIIPTETYQLMIEIVSSSSVIFKMRKKSDNAIVLNHTITTNVPITSNVTDFMTFGMRANAGVTSVSSLCTFHYFGYGNVKPEWLENF